jgi:hypothetical protein
MCEGGGGCRVVLPPCCCGLGVISDVVPLVMVLLLLLLFPSHCRPIVSPWVLGRGFVGGFRQSPSANSTPNPPCEQLLAAVEVGAGLCSRLHPPCRRPLLLWLLVSLVCHGRRPVVLSLICDPPCIRHSSPVVVVVSTCDPPLLVTWHSTGVGRGLWGIARRRSVRCGPID